MHSCPLPPPPAAAAGTVASAAAIPHFFGICSHPTAACALVPHLIGAFLSVTARGGAARIAQQRGGKGQVPEVLLLLLDECDTLGCEREFSLLASVTRGSKRVDGGVEE